MVASIIRTIFTQPDTEHVFAQFHEVVRMLTRPHPRIADVLEGARGEAQERCGVRERAEDVGDHRYLSEHSMKLLHELNAAYSQKLIPHGVEKLRPHSGTSPIGSTVRSLREAGVFSSYGPEFG
ncbi:hypothetical protein [Microbacterium sp.]|uniref:hypothetical protein n=1 Tax=Microbacterium sp. TaxID=51671 RepID=UPI0028109DB4|nr:hypothetical protein [Microbacterium sp.]